MALGALAGWRWSWSGGERLKAKRFGEESVDFSFLREPAFQELKAARAEAVGAPTKVLLLRNVADAGEVDVDFECKLLEEARRFGRVRRCVVRECSAGADAGAVRAFLDFRLASDADRAAGT
ncbi:unnamed protein product [Prorocentrum cordatum]|uniref:Uncharacterized protein n=1 Tax=Prorocentrum cordatum TaxID=2364126 RepID=A0ABN9QV50_9DINO|nr:unnamed protein product [Polarella glacialis]